MSSRSYQGRHYAGRHRTGTRRVRPPRALSAGFVLPSTAAVALVATATGASVAESAQPLTLDLTGQQSAMVRTQEAAGEETTAELATRRQDAQMASSAIQGRAEEKARAARAAKRKAAAEAKARAAAEKRAKKWVRPIDTWHVSSGFGWRWGKQHDGMDLAAPTGTPLYSMSKGIVLSAGYRPSFGNKVEIQYWDGSISWYAHMSRIDVVAGQELVSGQQVGAVGNTGHSFGSHLHLEFQQTTSHDSPLDPVPWLQNKGLY